MSHSHLHNYLRKTEFGGKLREWALLILQAFHHFTYITAHSPTHLSLLLRNRLFTYATWRAAHGCHSKIKFFWSSYSNLSVTSPTSQLILQTFRRFTYVTAHSPTFPLLHLRHSSFSNPSFACPTSQTLHLIHLASRPCIKWASLSLSLSLCLCVLCVCVCVCVCL